MSLCPPEDRNEHPRVEPLTRMFHPVRVGIALLAVLTIHQRVAAAPATATSIDGLHFLVGTWTCTYRAGAARFPYAATYVYDRGGHTLRETASWAGGGDEELIGFDARRSSWTATVFEDTGATTILRGTGADPDHIAYRSVYPDAGIAEKIDRVSATEYTIHATTRSGGTTVVSVDTCVRDPR